MKKFLSVLGIIVMLSPTLPAFAQEKTSNLDQNKPQFTHVVGFTTTAYITTNNVNLRSAPGLSSTIYRQLNKNYEVLVDYRNNASVYADGHTWVKVTYGSLKGWVAEEYLRDF